MALSLSGAVPIVADSGFQGRVALGFYFVARQVYAESDQTPDHEARVRFARSILLLSMDDFLRYAALVVTDPAIVALNPAPTVGNPPSDAQIITAIQNVWTTLARPS